MWQSAPLLIQRIRTSRLLVGSVAVTAFVLALLLSALTVFGGWVLPLAAGRQLARSDTSTVIIGLVNASGARSDDRAVRATMREAFGRTGYMLREALWSDPLVLTAGSAATAGSPGAAGTARARARPAGTRAEIAAPGHIAEYAALTAGSWPSALGAAASMTAPAAAGAAIPAAVPADLARRLGLSPGGELMLRDQNNGVQLRVRITGLYRRLNPASPYWRLDRIWTCGASVTQCFAGPFVVSPAAFGHARLTVDQASWAAWPDVTAIHAADLGQLAARLGRADAYLQGSALGGLVVTSSLPAALTGTQDSLSVARAQLLLDALLLLLPAIVALALAARLLASHREDEAALLSARGAARWQLARPALAEAMTVGAVPAIAGALGGVWLASWLAGTGLLRGDGIRAPAAAWPAGGAWLAGLAVLVLCVLIMSWPTLRPAAVAGRAGKGRPAVVAGAVRAGADVALLALGAVALWELHANVAAGGLGTDPVLAIAPTVALAGLGIVTLRALPIIAKAIDRLAAGGRRLTVALASWELSRRPVRQSGPALLAILAVATGALALAQYSSWRRSAADQAAFTAGADVRVDTPSPLPPGRITGTAAVTAAMAASRVAMTSGGVFLAVGAHDAAATVLLRSDLSPLPAAALWRRLAAGESGGAVPAIMTRAFLAANHLTGTGATADLPVSSATVTVRVAAVVTGFPTVTGPGGGVVVDLSTVRHALGGQGRSALPVTEWWLRTAGGGVPPGLRSRLPAGSVVTDPAGELAAVTGDPLSAAPQQAALAITVASALLAAIGFCVGVGASLRSRGWQAALLTALGVRRRALALQLALEQLMLTVPAALAGLLAAAIIARLFIPAVTLTTAGNAPALPALVEFPVGQAGLLAAAVVAIPILAAAATAARRPDAAARLRFAEAA